MPNLACIEHGQVVCEAHVHCREAQWLLLPNITAGRHGGDRAGEAASTWHQLFQSPELWILAYYTMCRIHSAAIPTLIASAMPGPCASPVNQDLRSMTVEQSEEKVRSVECGIGAASARKTGS